MLIEVNKWTFAGHSLPFSVATSDKFSEIDKCYHIIDWWYVFPSDPHTPN